MKTWLLLAALLLPTLLPAAAPAPTIPQPPELEPDVRFWMRVYSEVSTNEGFIHDQWNLAVVYETLHFGAELPPRQRELQVNAAREHYQGILRQLGSGAAAQTDEERRVLALWGEADARRLGQAANDVRFQLGQSDRFRAGLQRAGIWEAHIGQTLAAQGLPAEIAALPHVESSFQPEAMSKAGAAGLWQFIRSTGRRFLRIDRAVDERLDPYRATEAAAQLLAYNYRVLGTWPLAITAYNHGAAGMRRAREQLGTDDIVRIVRDYRSPSFGFASRNYYCSFLAALRLDREPEKYFGALQRAADAPSQELALPTAARIDALGHALNLDPLALRALNPALRATVWNRQQPVPRGYRLRVPADSGPWTTQQLLARLAGTGADAGAAVVAANKPAPMSAATSAAPVAQVPVAQVPVAQAPTARPSAAALVAVESRPGEQPLAYVVRTGDSLDAIATQRGLDPQQLMRLNGLNDEEHLYEGQRLALVPSTAAAAALAQQAARTAEADRQEELQATAAAAAVARAAPALTAAQANAQGPTLVPDEVAPPSADPIDYSVRADDTLVVVAAETIGHYADWLGVPTASLRALNGMHRNSTVLMGRRFRLAFTRVTREQFEQRRRDYHQQLQTDYFAAHHIVGTDSYGARRGDSLWSLTQRGALPVWLLQQYNPDVDFNELRPGTQIVLPKVEDAS